MAFYNDLATIISATLPKLSGTLIIVLLVVISRRTVNSLLRRWQTKIIGKLKKKKKANISATETKIVITRRILNATIYFVALIFFLLQFQAMRNIGTGLLASAGVAGIVIGMAAQNTLSNVISGIYISFAQPVRLKDAVIFEGDFGWIEEISLAHTIIKTWDNRRIIAPNNIIANKVMQNWSLKDTSLLGVVIVYLDYHCDIDTIREWVKDLVEQSSYASADKIYGVQVIDFTEKAMVVRILAKGDDAATTWNLRCQIREMLVKKFKESKMPMPVFRIKQYKTTNNNL